MIVPDRHGTGTNALALTPPDVMAPAFGEGSFERHRGWPRRPAPRSSWPTRGRSSSTSTRRTTSRRCAAPWPRGRAEPSAPGGCSRTPRLLELHAVPGLPEIRPGDDLAALLAGACELGGTDVLCVAHKVVSKAEGRIVRLADVDARARARSRWPPSTARTRGCSRSCSRRRPRWCAPTPGGSSAARGTGSCARTRASTRPTWARRRRSILLPLDPDALGAGAARARCRGGPRS